MKGIDGASTVFDPIGSTPKAPNSSVTGDVATIFVAAGSANIAGAMNDEAFAALEAAYIAAAESRGSKPVKVAKPRAPKVKSAITRVKGVDPVVQ
jgi:hypothetical protein